MTMDVNLADYPTICLAQTLAIFFSALRHAFVIQEEKMVLYYHSIAPADDEDITRGKKMQRLDFSQCGSFFGSVM